MGGTIRVRIRGGMFEALEKVEPPEGKEMAITILDVPPERDFEAFRRAAGGWNGTIDAEALIRNIYADRLIATSSEASALNMRPHSADRH